MNQRYYSLDVFRGAAVAMMILVNNPGNWDYIYTPLDHAKWNGCTPTDLVFPFFLFAVGNAMSFTMPKLQQAGTNIFLKKVLKRFALIFLIGLFLNWSPFLIWKNNDLIFKSWTWTDDKNAEHGIRILGVLQRIALCYLFASLIIYFFKTKGSFAISIFLLMMYWVACIYFGNTASPFSLEGYFGTAVDKNILGELHMYHGEGTAFDPEGIMSTIPAIVQVIFGFIAGEYIKQKGKSYEMLSNLFIAGLLLIFAGQIWNLQFPVIKKIWSSSYVVYTSGMAMVILGIFIYLLEFKNAKGGWSRFFDVFGKNPLFIFVLSGFLPRLLGLIRINSGFNDDGTIKYISPFGWFYEHVCRNISADMRIGSLLYAIIMILFYWLIVFILDKKKIYIRV
jgi:predicted acyltransferase